MRIIKKGPGFDKKLSELVSGLHEIPPEIMKKASAIFDDVGKRGEKALFEYTERFEGHKLTPGSVEVSEREMDLAEKGVPKEAERTMRAAASRIKAFHRCQARRGFVFDDGSGTVIEERVLAIRRVGICVPGGRAPLASTVLMTAIPAKIAGVKEIVMISPWPGGEMNKYVLAAAKIAGVDRAFKIGGAQGVAAIAHGASRVPRVDKIVGPGSMWVTAAKAIAQSKGLCGIDSVAGPSEIVIVADEKARPDLVAIDLLSQAEHGLDSSSILLTDSEELANKVGEETVRLAREMSHSNPDIKRAEKKIAAVVTGDLDEAARIADELAPEHLEIIARNPKKLLARIENAGSVFLGPYSPVPAGDYMAGANHVLPTGGTSRFSSPLGVADFVKRQSVTRMSRKALESIAEPCSGFAEMEGLTAHARSVLMRVEKDKGK